MSCDVCVQRIELRIERIEGFERWGKCGSGRDSNNANTATASASLNTATALPI